MARIRRRLLISGRVQGVCFRHHTRQTAQNNGVTGWVRNLPDGRVEVVLEGEESTVMATVDGCRRGPEWARVDTIDIQEQEIDNDFAGFTIR